MEGKFFQAGFYYAIKDSVLCYPSRLWTLFTYMFPITLLFLRSFSPLFTSSHVPSTASSLVHTINIYLSVDLCDLHNNVLYCLSFSLRLL